MEIPRGGGLWGRGGERGGGLARQESLARSRLHLARASPSVCLRGHPADTASWGPGPPLLEPCQPQHLSAWAQHGGGFWCQLERVPAQLSGGERKNGQAARSLFGIQPQHLRPLASAFLHRAVPLCMIGELALPVREAQVE